MNNLARQQKAASLFKSGYNCSQAVCGAFSDITGLSEETLLRLSSSFGGGFGRMRELCGAVSGMGIVLGLLYGEDTPEAKEKQYKLVQLAAKEFEKQNTSLNCGILLKDIKDITSGPVPQERTELYYQTRPCIKFVLDATEITQNIIDGKLVLE